MQVPAKAVEPSVANPLYLWLICLVAALGGLLFGYDWVVIGGAKLFYETYFSVHDPVMSGWLVGRPLWPPADADARRGSVRRMCDRHGAGE